MMSRRILVLLTALFALTIVLTGSAQAELANHKFEPKRWDEPFVNEEEGRVLPSPLLPEEALTGFESPNEEFRDPCGLISDGPTLFIADYYHNLIQEFGSPYGGETHYYAQLPQYPGDAFEGNGPCQMAMGTNGSFNYTDMYVNLWHGEVVAMRQNAEGFWGLFPMRTVVAQETTGIAVHKVNPKNRLEDILYANHRTYIGVYHQDGEPVMEGGEPLRIGVGSLGDGFGLARSSYPASDGYLYVADASDNTLKVYDPATDINDPIQVIEGSETPLGHFNHLEDAGIAVDNITGHVYIADQLPGRTDEPPAQVYEYGRFGNYRGELPETPEPLISSVPTGIAIDENAPGDNGNDSFSGYIYVTTGFGGPGGVYAFTPEAPTKALEIDMTGTGGGKITSFPEGVDCEADCGTEFAVGKLVTLTATPNIRSKFIGWTVNGSAVPCPTTGPCDVQLEQDAKVTAQFDGLPQKSLSVSKTGAGTGTVTSAPEGIDCGSTCSSTFNEGSTVTLTATPGEHAAFVGWTVSGKPAACPGTGTCAVEMSAAANVSANFAPVAQKSLSVSLLGNGTGVVSSSPSGIDCGSMCAAPFDSDSVVTLAATPAPGSRFAGWSGSDCSGTGSCEVAMNGGSAVSATFERNEHTVTVTTAGAGRGAVSSQPNGIACGAACSHQFFEGERVTMTAVPATGSVFAGWSGPCTGRRRCDVAINEDMNVRAEFRVAEWTLAVVVSGEGSGTVVDPAIGINCGLACSGVYLYGTSATLVAKPSPGSYLAAWRGCDLPAGSTCHATVDREETVHAVFALSPKVVLGKIRTHKGVKTLKVTPSAPGVVSVKGKGLMKDAAETSAADEPVTLKLELSAAGRRRLNDSKDHEIVIEGVVKFAPRDAGPAVSKTIFIDFKGER
jgi:hypothetical protein